jgi:hypothetical protein
MASPVQIVLNPENFEEAREAGGGGRKKDFYAHRDQDFVQHKQAVKQQVSSIIQSLNAQAPSTGKIGYIKVNLKREAWAKSHRPIKSLFKLDRVKLAGGGDLGEMYFEVTPSTLASINVEIDQAEEATTLKLNPKSGKREPDPSSQRSELGAIDRVELIGAQDKRSFSVQEAVQWLQNPLTGGSYHVELFEAPLPSQQRDGLSEDRRKLYTSFEAGLRNFGLGLTIRRLSTKEKFAPLLAVRLNRGPDPVALMLTAASTTSDHRNAVAPFDNTADKHKRLLDFLDKHPLVRRINLPGVIVKSAPPSVRQRPSAVQVPTRDSTRAYPKIGIIDGGVGPSLSDWLIGNWNLVADTDKDPRHGTFIAGLTVLGAALNGTNVCPELDGAEIFDLGILPSENAFQDYYPEGIPQFLDEMELAIADARARHGVRIFNMSLNVKSHLVELDYYSEMAARLDKIADEQNVIIFISAGNTEPQDMRAEWHSDERQALSTLAAARNDGLLVPAESARNVTVGALNPPDCSSIVPFAPARYSRRGPGLRTGVKPDLAHVGGSGTLDSTLNRGLFSINPDGSLTDGCGTSYATPLVAKTAASLERAIEGEVSRETLIGMLAHHAVMPGTLQSRTFENVARHLAGYGVPLSANEMLVGGDNEITLVFASRIKPGQQVNFRFNWPACLVAQGGICRGNARLTLVSSPPLDQRFGSEFVRVNIDASLQQEQAPKIDPDTGEVKPGGWKGRLNPIYLPEGSERALYEAERIEQGLKWSPIKIYEKSMPRGHGPSSSWRLFVEYITRTGEEMPEDGVPFTVILTIKDLEGNAPVFNDMRQTLVTVARIADIRTAARITPRV